MNTQRTRTPLSALAVLAALLLGTATPSGAVGVSPGNVAGSCADTTEPNLDGGSSVSCTLACGNLAELGIAAASADDQWGIPKVQGTFACGGTAALCKSNPGACVGASPGTTNQPQMDGDCSANSDEWIASPMWVACVVIGGVDSSEPTDPNEVKKVVCEEVPDFPTCPRNGTSGGHGGGYKPFKPRESDFFKDPQPSLLSLQFGLVEDLCLYDAAQKGLTISQEDQDGMFPPAFGALQNVTGFVAATLLPDRTTITAVFPAGPNLCAVNLNTVT